MSQGDSRKFSDILAGTNMTYAQISSATGYSERTIYRWKNGEKIPKKAIIDYVTNHIAKNSSGNKRLTQRKYAFTFIDLFAGIGGTRAGFESAGGKCVFTSEWDKYCLQTYKANFPSDNHQIAGDITQFPAEDIPNHDVLVAGFPCQPFSIAGVSKKNSLGRSHGFADKTQGTLFFDILRIIKHKKPKAFLLENVKNLTTHDGGRTFEIIQRSLKELGYTIHYKVIDAQAFVPQHRERIFIVGFRKDVNFEFPDLKKKKTSLRSILQKEVDNKYTLSDKLWQYLVKYKEKHRAKGNGFGYSLVGPSDIARTLSARYHKDGSEILISQGNKKNPRRLTPRECSRLMGFPDNFKISVSDTQAYRQFGNSVVVPVIAHIAKAIAKHIT